MNILVLYTLPPESLTGSRTVDEFDLSYAAGGLANALECGAPVGVRGEPREIVEILQARRPEAIVNLCEAPLGRPDLEPHVAALFEWLGIPFTGCSSETLALCRRKDRTRALLAAAGIAVPRLNRFPCLVKPVAEDGSAGIDAASIYADAPALERARAKIDGPVLVEEFLPGREFVVSLWGRDDPDYSSLGEVVLDEGLQLLTYAAKWEYDSDDFASVTLDYQPALTNVERDAMLAAARGAWRAVGARGYLRVDFRWDAAQTPHVLDVNPNPEVTPGRGGMYRSVTEAGWKWEDFARALVEWARC